MIYTVALQGFYIILIEHILIAVWLIGWVVFVRELAD